MLKIISLIILSVSAVNALTISSVLNDGQGDFDPWNTTRWAAWYSGGKLVKQFDIDCNVKFADRGGESNPWEPDISSHETGRMFLVGNTGRGVTIDGGGIFIDVRGTKPSLSQLYSMYWLYSESSRHPMQYCFNFSQSYSSSIAATRIKNVWMKGFVQAIRTTFATSQRHPLIIEDCEFRRNQWGVYLSGNGAIVQNCGIKQNAKGGIYSGAGAYGNSIINNYFQDNNYEQSKYYGDIAMDTAYNTIVQGNTHQAPTGGSHQCGIKMYRNFGESGQLREHSVHHNLIRDNSFDGYSVAYDVGSRQGHVKDYDLSFEGRDYAENNIFEYNVIANTTIGIKLNCPANTIRNNTFTNVSKPIVLHCVFYNLTHTVINAQSGTNVYYWFVPSDYSSYSSWFPYQDDLTSSIPESEKLIQVRSDYGAPNYQNYTGAATVIKAPSLAAGSPAFGRDITGDQKTTMDDFLQMARNWRSGGCNVDNDFCGAADLNCDGAVNSADLKVLAGGWLVRNDIADIYSTGVKPIDIAVGDFWVDNPGDELAVIWDTPVSNIDGTNYYSIVIYDSSGIEINRCGRSTTKWHAITAGNFVNLVGTYNVVEGGDEIAAVPATAVGGYYPVYVFGRGRKDASVTLMTSNTKKIADIAGGNFLTTGDTNDEIALIYDGGASSISYCKPTNTSWTATTTGVATARRIAAGNFDGTSSNGDEIAVINGTTSLIYFYRAGGSSSFSTAATSALPLWAEIAAGDFNGGASRDEVAVISATPNAGIYKISCYTAGVSAAFKEMEHDVQTSQCVLAAGLPSVGYAPAMYERASGFNGDYSQSVRSWGDCVVLLPSSQPEAAAAYWINAAPADSAKQYLKVTPILR